MDAPRGSGRIQPRLLPARFAGRKWIQRHESGGLGSFGHATVLQLLLLAYRPRLGHSQASPGSSVR
jgi:hypothetical protein